MSDVLGHLTWSQFSAAFQRCENRDTYHHVPVVYAEDLWEELQAAVDEDLRPKHPVILHTEPSSTPPLDDWDF